MRYKGIKAKAWEAVKSYVRKKEKHCYTCNAKNLLGANAQSGHFIPVALAGSNNTLSWDERFIHLQCSRCNGAGQGMAIEYRGHLVKDYGEKTVAEAEKRRWRVDPIKDWLAIIAKFKALESALI